MTSHRKVGKGKGSEWSGVVACVPRRSCNGTRGIRQHGTTSSSGFAWGRNVCITLLDPPSFERENLGNLLATIERDLGIPFTPTIAPEAANNPSTASLQTPRDWVTPLGIPMLLAS